MEISYLQMKKLRIGKFATTPMPQIAAQAWMMIPKKVASSDNEPSYPKFSPNFLLAPYLTLRNAPLCNGKVLITN